jgi:hypothetical protein
MSLGSTVYQVLSPYQEDLPSRSSLFAFNVGRCLLLTYVESTVQVRNLVEMGLGSLKLIDIPRRRDRKELAARLEHWSGAVKMG